MLKSDVDSVVGRLHSVGTEEVEGFSLVWLAKVAELRYYKFTDINAISDTERLSNTFDGTQLRAWTSLFICG